MVIKKILKIEIECDRCTKVIAYGKASSGLLTAVEEESSYTELYCTFCAPNDLRSSFPQSKK